MAFVCVLLSNWNIDIVFEGFSSQCQGPPSRQSHHSHLRTNPLNQQVFFCFFNVSIAPKL